MRKIIAVLVATGAFVLASNASACSLGFQIDGDPTFYAYNDLPAFIVQKLRPSLAKTTDNDRYNLRVSYRCDPGDAGQAMSMVFNVEKNTMYLKEVNGVPLCIDVSQNGHTECAKGQYNYESYNGGARLAIDEATVIDALQTLSRISDQTQLADAAVSPATEAPIHNAVRTFAMLLAETTRFDYVLDDLTCSIKSQGSIQFMDYWGLVHNWATISERVQQSDRSLIPADAHYGSGQVFIPITRDMIPFFNQSLVDDPPAPSQLSGDGKNQPIPVRPLACDLLEALTK
jgi:hypothetical protein